MKVAAVILLLAMPLVAGAQELDINVVGLFKDAAVLEINGKREMLKRGHRSPEGLQLIRADSREAVVELNGERMKLTLSSRISTRFKPFEGATVSIPLNNAGQYQGTGTINDHPVSFLIDTGATIVAMNTSDARKLGIDYSGEGQMRAAMTAGGVVKSWAINLDSIQVGGIRVNNVPAAVLQGDYPQKILLGMTFLRNLEIKQSEGIMVLKSKF